MKRLLSVSIFLLLLHFNTFCQISLANPSFEGEPIDATVPKGWHPCKEGTTPDILPGFWGVNTKPSDGRSYMGLITREDGTWESVGQRLKESLEAGGCYTFSCELAHSNTYAGYNIPLKLRIWGSTYPCGKEELLAETKTIEHLDWQTYEFEFLPKKNLQFIVFEAYYASGVYFHYNGNLLMDNCSVINRCRHAMRVP